MKRVGVFIYLASNIFLLTFYIKDVIRYVLNRYNYDGIRYLVPMAIADLLFFISLIIIFFSIKFNKDFFIFFLLALFHNIAIGTGVENIPFVGVIVVILSILFIAKVEIFKR